MNQLNAYLALEVMHDHMERAERHRRAHAAQEQPPGSRHRPDMDAPHPGARPRLVTRRLRRALAVLRRVPATLRS